MRGYTKTAKDRAFDIERLKLKSQASKLAQEIRRLKLEVQFRDATIEDLKKELEEKDQMISKLEELQGISHEDLEKLFKDLFRKEKVYSFLSTTENMFHT